MKTLASGGRIRTRQLRASRSSDREDPQLALAKSQQGAGQSTFGTHDSTNLLGGLQRSAGNRATAGWLSTQRQSAAESHIMRYPSSVLDSPLKSKEWKKYTSTVVRSGEGLTGIYFFKSKRGSVKEVVVKAGMAGDEPEEKEQANALMASAGVPVPKTRIVPVASAEAWEIGLAGEKRGAGRNLADIASYFEVMAVASGKSLSNTAKKAGEGTSTTEIADKVDQLIGLLSTSNVQMQLGQLMARDVILGNIDRAMMYASEGWSNLGNIMVTPGNDNKALPRALHSRIAAIDNEVGGDTGGTMAIEARQTAVEELGTNPAAPVDRILHTLERTLASVNPEAGTIFRQHPKYAELRESLIASLKRAALKEATLGVIRGPAPLAPTGNAQPAQNRPEAKPEGKFEAEMRKRRRAVWEALKG